MRKTFTKILISVFMVGVFLLPFSGQVSIENQKIKLILQKNTIFAGFYYQTDNGNGGAGPWGGGPNGFDTLEACQAETDVIEDQNQVDIIQPCIELATPPTSPGGSAPAIQATQGQLDEYKDINFGCISLTSFSILGCVNALLYYAIFTPLSWIMTISGEILDFFLFYSTSDVAYSSGFIGKAWGAVRDISNIFFIIALLFVAIKTVLSINVSNNKKLVGWIVLMALLINFSLFATQVIIDSTNILARVFYNEITAKGKSGEKVGENEEKSVSLALISIFNPQRIVDGELNNQPGTVLIVLILSIVVVAVTIYVFLSVALLFVARVANLWLQMIFSPIAFASKSTSIKIKYFGFDEWLSNTVQYAFMAPIFIFFLYVIVLLADSLKGLVGFSSSQNDQWLTSFMNVLIPFVIITILLLKARELAVKSSGEMGAAINGAAKLVGGFAGGAALGAVAFGGTKLIGGMASKMASSETLKAKAEQGGLGGYMARMQLKAANYGSKASFDVRQTAAGKQLSKVSGMNFQSAKILGLDSKKDGFKGMVERKYDKIQKESELYKTTMSDTEVKKWSEERQLKYYEEREKAKANNTLEAFDAKHSKPKTYRNASELNNDKMKAFQEKIGRSGLIGSLIYSSMKKVDTTNYRDDKAYQDAHREKAYQEAKKEKLLAHAKDPTQTRPFKESEAMANFDQEYKQKYLGEGKQLNFDGAIAEKINNDRLKKKKNIVGGTAGAIIGTVVGGTLAGPIGAFVGGDQGRRLGLNNEMSVSAQAAKKFGGTIKKETERLTKIDDKIDELENIKKDQEKILKEGLESKFDLGENKITITNESGKLDKNALERIISDRAMDTDRDKEELKDIAKKIVALKGEDYEEGKDMVLDGSIRTLNKQFDDIKKTIGDRAIEVKKLNEIKEAEEKIRNTDNQISNLKGNRTPPAK